MRLLLLPISTRRFLIYCEPAALNSSSSKQSLLDRLVNKANATWVDWEKNTDSYLNWKKRTTDYGNMMFRRIPYEEWGLKSIPRQGHAPISSTSQVEVQYPSLYQGLCKEGVFDIVKRIATERQSLHRNRIFYSIAGMPLTIPVGLLPIIPNLPFFYLVFRAYSHWRALSGSRALESMLASGVLQLKPNSTLDTLYTAGLLYPSRAASRNAPEPTLEQTRAVVECLRQQTNPNPPSEKPISPTSSTQSLSSSERTSTTSAPTAIASTRLLPGRGKRLYTGEEEVMLLQGWNGKLLAERLRLSGLEVEIERAVEQVQDGIEKDKGELIGEKKELEDLVQRFRAQSKAVKAV